MAAIVYHPSIHQPGTAQPAKQVVWREVPVSQMVHHPLQPTTRLSERWVDDNIVKPGYDPILANSLTVGFLDGIYYVLDGWHRFVGARKSGIATVMCQVLFGYDTEELARYWLKLNRIRRRPQSNEEFEVGLTARDEVIVKAHEIAMDYGFSFTRQAPRYIKATKALEDVLQGRVTGGGQTRTYSPEEGPRILRSVLQVIVGAWDGGTRSAAGRDRSAAVHATTIKGLALFLFRYSGSVKINDLIERLAAVTPAEIGRAGAAKANEAKTTYGSGNANAVRYYAEAVRDVYNYRRTNRLPALFLEQDSLGRSR